jgi:hypothetical protein
MVVNNVLDGQAHPVIDIEAASQLSVAMVENSEHLSAAVALLVKRGRAKRDVDKVVIA